PGGKKETWALDFVTGAVRTAFKLLRLSPWVRRVILGMAGRRHDEHVVPHKIVDHQIHLVWNLKLVEVAGTYRPTVDDLRKPLRHEMRWIPWRCGCERKCRHC